jgi:predicted amidophosphoribosyltransferase
MDEAYQDSLEEEALLQTLEEFSTCPGCNRQVMDGWVICPDCHTRLKKKCQKCGNSLIPTWEICPYCEEIQHGYHRNEFESNPINPISQSIPETMDE